jgi:hypothetical protein
MKIGTHQALLEIDLDELNSGIEKLCWELPRSAPDRAPQLRAHLAELMARRSNIVAGISGDMDARQSFLTEAHARVDAMIARMST